MGSLASSKSWLIQKFRHWSEHPTFVIPPESCRADESSQLIGIMEGKVQILLESQSPSRQMHSETETPGEEPNSG